MVEANEAQASKVTADKVTHVNSTDLGFSYVVWFDMEHKKRKVTVLIFLVRSGLDKAHGYVDKNNATNNV